jgi:arsenite/tail-anchored protein-transporting ATPase
MHVPLAELVREPTPFLFFTGKGGVGKTSLACATAVALADTGKRVLLVSTDPASNLDEVLGQKLANSPTPISRVPRLSALNIDPEAAARAYRERLVGPYRGVLPDAALRSMEEQLSGACTLEIAAFDEFTKLLGDPAATADFEHVIFDTAPTGHTLRLLKLPGAWTGFIATNSTGTSCLGPLAGLQAQRRQYEASVEALADATRATLLLVSRPQLAALREADRTRGELSALGMNNQRLIVNSVFHTQETTDAIASALEARGAAALARMPAPLAVLPIIEVPLLSHNLVGVAALRALYQLQGNFPASVPMSTDGELPPLDPLSALVDDLAKAGRGVVLTMGKGGVGKTTIAAAIATELARRGFTVHLSTTDPAAHVAAVASEQSAGLRVSQIDPAVETRAYVAQVMSTAGRDLDAKGRALLEEDLRSPCTEEVAVFRAFARIVAEGKDSFVVLDTAPTGHTLLLLDATEAYHREVARNASNLPEEVRELLPRLRDREFTRILIVTLPEPTPVHEAAALQSDLRRAHIEPWAWVINQSFVRCGTADPVLAARGHGEVPFIKEVLAGLSHRTALVPWFKDEPVGPAKLRQLLEPLS